MARNAPIAPNIKKNPKYIHGLPAAEFNRLGKHAVAARLEKLHRDEWKFTHECHADDMSRLGESNAKLLEEINRLSRDLEKAKRESEMRACALHAAAFCLPAEHEKALRVFANSRTT